MVSTRIYVYIFTKKEIEYAILCLINTNNIRTPNTNNYYIGSNLGQLFKTC